MTARVLLFIGALSAALAVVAGAYGAHAIKDPTRVALFHTAIQYHLFHALGLLVVGIVALLRPSSALFVVVGGLMLLGILLFCGSLYLHAFTGYRGLSAVTPFGGTAFILAWLVLAAAVLRLN